jgi:hypothetical protein
MGLVARHSAAIGGPADCSGDHIGKIIVFRSPGDILNYFLFFSLGGSQRKEQIKPFGMSQRKEQIITAINLCPVLKILIQNFSFMIRKKWELCKLF